MRLRGEGEKVLNIRKINIFWKLFQIVHGKDFKFYGTLYTPGFDLEDFLRMCESDRQQKYILLCHEFF